MKKFFLQAVFVLLSIANPNAFATLSNNQTDSLSPVLPETSLPFRIILERANFQLPMGYHSGVIGTFQGNWVLIGGRTNGLHGFEPTNNFPAASQNTNVYVVNSLTGAVQSRSLYDANSGLTQQQIDTLSVTSPQGYQEGNTLYMTGGYGINANGAFTTKPVLTAFNLPGVVAWVTKPQDKTQTLAKNIRQIVDPVFQITGGRMYKLGNTFQLVFGQTFEGEYTDSSNGIYSKQVRRFELVNQNGNFTVKVLSPMPAAPNANFRRRDLNVVPTLLPQGRTLQYGLIAFSGVFTLATGVWTVPVIMDGVHDPLMANPSDPTTFKQAMNHYISPTASLYSRRDISTYHLFFGGISFGFYQNGAFETDSEIPFINQITTIKQDQNNQFTQYLMSAEYPVIPSTGPHPGNRLLFGAGAYFIPAAIMQYPNGVLSLDSIRQATVIGHIVGGIQSTLANTNSMSDSTASPYIFKVTLVPTRARVTLQQSSNAMVLADAKPLTTRVSPPAGTSTHKHNHKYHQSQHRQATQSHHSA